MATTQVMGMLRDNPDAVDVRIYGTNVLRDAPALAACDVGESEPRYVGDDEYAAFAVEFCRRHAIDVLIPPRRLAALAGRAEEFAAVGTRLMCSPPEAVDVLTSKGRTYEAARAAGVPVPPWRVVSDAEGFRAAVGELGETGERMCVKPAGEFSAFGFRILEDRPLRLKDLLAAPVPLASVASVAGALKRAADEGEAVPEFLVMPYLDGPEVSVDCLSAPGGAMLTGIARSKQGRYRLLLDDPALVAIARRLVGHFRLAYLSNVQLRYRRGRPVLLEANPRASAGIFQTAFTGVNLPWSAVRLLLRGDAGALPAPRLGGRIAITESATEMAAAIQLPEPAPLLEPAALLEPPAPLPEPVRVLTGIDGARSAALRTAARDVVPPAPLLGETATAAS
ncbi:ATP-grasp domain-containing protein [Streptomyces sp. NPDC008139]|uniref:ATP-grasp domain-containing protein n=1 Tax=Streptomyces sp. NPDC008139 TaxID=3364814 RepID=UPI0036E5F68E